MPRERLILSRRSLLSAVAAGFVGTTARPASAAPLRRTRRAWLQDQVLNVKDFGAVGNGAVDDQPAIQAAIDAAEAANLALRIPAGRYLLGATIEWGSANVFGDGRGKTILEVASHATHNGSRTDGSCTLAHFTIDMGTPDDTLTGSGIIMPGATDCLIFDVEVKGANRQGFAIGTAGLRNKIVSYRAENCGHRGMNISARSDHNIITDFHAIDCGFSGLLIGFLSRFNIVTGLRVMGFEVSPGVVVHMGASRNVLSDVIISHPASDTEPFLQVGAASLDNLFTNFVLNGVTDRGILIRNEDVQDPPASSIELGNGPTARNVFRGFKIIGTGATGSVGIVFDEVTGQEHGSRGHRFEDFYIERVDDAVRDESDTATDCVFRAFRFNAIRRRLWNLSAGKRHIVQDYEGLTYSGSLAG